MAHLTKYITELMEKLRLPVEAVECFAGVFIRIDGNAGFSAEFDKAVSDYLSDSKLSIGGMLPALDAMGEKYEVRNYTLHFVFILSLTENLLAKYREKGIDEKIYWRTMDDLRCKLLECMECKGYPGTFVASWFDGFFRMNRFGLGRFQYEIKDFPGKSGVITKSGIIIPENTRVINLHIPSSGIPLTDDVRFDSYKRAYDFYKHLFWDGVVIFVCGTWLFYGNHRKFLPKNSNILRFMDDFQIIGNAEKPEFHDAWRVFGKYADLPPEKLPRDTSLRKAYAEWLTAGNRAGDGFGVMAFDGEKIVT